MTSMTGEGPPARRAGEGLQRGCGLGWEPTRASEICLSRQGGAQHWEAIVLRKDVRTDGEGRLAPEWIGKEALERAVGVTT